MKPRSFLLALFLMTGLPLFSQISFNAQTRVDTYTGIFGYGVNLGWYDGSWDDQAMSNIAVGNPSLNIKGAGANTLRPKVYEQFTEQWGIGILNDRFQHFSSIGASNLTLFVDLPVAASHADNSFYEGCSNSSKLYANMYEPIWDGGANGTPVNENNYYAVYIYNLAKTYKQYVKFWEIVNEPDQDWGLIGWRPSGDPLGNWWDHAPKTCELKNIYVPIYRYIRLLRISYEVIKSVDPSAYVTPGGIGYPSFLDALLRYTDNPSDGTVTGSYPNKGGAYFDCVSIHCYPYLDMGVINRHSDKALEFYASKIDGMNQVLANRGYNGVTYPRKLMITTEINTSRKNINGIFGGVEAQRNFMIKSLVESQKKGLWQTQVYCLGDYDNYGSATDPFSLMGLYTNLKGIGPLWNGGQYNQQFSEGGLAFKTTADLLKGYHFDSGFTRTLALPANIDGGAFKNGVGEIILVLWAKTSIDNSETASAVYNFPGGINVNAVLYKFDWNYSSTGLMNSIPKTNINLTGSPIFLKSNFEVLAINNPGTVTPAVDRVFSWNVFPNPVHANVQLQINIRKRVQLSGDLYDAAGRYIARVLPAIGLSTGSHTLSLQIPASLARGMYIFKLNAEEQSYSMKLQIVK